MGAVSPRKKTGGEKSVERIPFVEVGRHLLREKKKPEQKEEKGKATTLL